MTNIFSKLLVLVFIILAGLGGYFWGNRKSGVNSNQVVATTSEQVKEESKVLEQSSISSPNIFKFHNFHGQDLGTAGFELEIPKGWRNDGQYFSPQKIHYYDMLSTDAPAYYDLISEYLIDTSDLKYQITKGKRNKPDSTVAIDGRQFNRYDLIDSQIKDRVVIYAGPKVDILGQKYYLIFRWEDLPLGITISGNSLDTFEKMIGSLKFTK